MERDLAEPPRPAGGLLSWAAYAPDTEDPYRTVVGPVPDAHIRSAIALLFTRGQEDTDRFFLALANPALAGRIAEWEGVTAGR